MKYLKLLLVVFAVASLSSCSKSDDEDSVTVSGNKYETTYAKLSIEIDGINQTYEMDSKDKLKENEMYFQIDFKSDNAFWSFEDGEWVEVGTWSQKNNKITITFTDDQGEQTIEATVDGNEIYMSIDFNPNDEEVKAERSKRLVTDKGKVEYTFTKI